MSFYKHVVYIYFIEICLFCMKSANRLYNLFRNVATNVLDDKDKDGVYVYDLIIICQLHNSNIFFKVCTNISI